MADNTYLSVDGFVQFEVKERDANGQTVRDVTVKPTGSDKLVRITLWPEFSHAPCEEGDFIAAEGKFTRSTYQGQDGESRESRQISANKLFINGTLYKSEERSTTNSSSQDKDEDLF